MAVIYEQSGAFFFRAYSSVNILNGAPIVDDGQGKPLRVASEYGRLAVKDLTPNGGGFKRLLTEYGRPARIQQSIRLVNKDNDQHQTKDSKAVRRLALDKEEEIELWEKQVGNGEECKPDGNIKVCDFFNEVFLPVMQREKQHSTIESYKGYWDTYLKDFFNHSKTLRNFEPWMATNFLEKLAASKSKNTIAHVRALGSAIFTYAVSKGYFPKGVENPWQGVRKNIACKKAKETVAYKREEVEQIVDALDHVSGREKHSARTAGVFVSVCFYAGLRPSEAAGLRWENIDFEKNTIHVCQAVVGGKFKDVTKTTKPGEENDTRTVIMLNKLPGRMRFWHAEWKHPSNGWVFPNQSGDAPINVNDLSSRTIGKMLKERGMEWHGFYACRRGFGTEMFNDGDATGEQIAAAMGNSLEVAFKNYVKDKSRSAAKGMKKWGEAMEAMEAGEISGGDKLLTGEVL